MKTKKVKQNLAIFIIGILLIISVIINVYLILIKYEETPKLEISELKTLSNFSELDINNYTEINNITVDANNMYLTNNCRTISMGLTQQQLYSIQKGLEKRVEFRPMTHDLIKNIFGFFNINVLMVKIEPMQEGAYFSTIILKRDDKILVLDSRPSDAVAIAVRTNTPVYMKNDLFKYSFESC